MFELRHRAAASSQGQLVRRDRLHLVPVGIDGEGPDAPPDSGASLADLRKRAYAASGPAQNKGVGSPRTIYQRSADVRAYVLSRANGHCEGCGAPAPFVTTAGTPYLEPHLIDRLSDGGPDDPRRVAGICPNCHKRVHFGADGTEFNSKLRMLVTALETAAGAEPAEDLPHTALLTACSTSSHGWNPASPLLTAG